MVNPTHNQILGQWNSRRFDPLKSWEITSIPIRHTRRYVVSRPKLFESFTKTSHWGSVLVELNMAHFGYIECSKKSYLKLWNWIEYDDVRFLDFYFTFIFTKSYSVYRVWGQQLFLSRKSFNFNWMNVN